MSVQALMRGLRTRRRILAGVALLVIYAWLGFPEPVPYVGTGLDNSWIWGLNLAHLQGAIFGRDLIFTYGPLAYLLCPLAVGNNYAQGFALGMSLHALVIGTVAGVLVRTQRVVPVAMTLAGLLGVHIAWVDGTYWQLFALLTGACAAFVFRWRLLAIFLSVPAAVALFIKFNSGVLDALMMGTFALAWIVRWRSWRVPLAGALLYLVVLGITGRILFGSAKGAVSFLRLSTEIAVGYNATMSREGPLVHVFLGLGSIGLACVTLAWFAYRRRLASTPWLLLASLLPLIFKHSFIRQDEGHVGVLFVTLLAACALSALFTETWGERVWLGSFYGLLVGALFWSQWVDAASVTKAFKARFSGRVVSRAIEPWILGKKRLGSVIHETLKEDVLPEEWRPRLTNAPSVMVVPWEIALCQANGLRCISYPTLQMYSTYTPALDAWAARRLQENPPEYVIASVTTIDDRQTLWDCPYTWRELLASWTVAVGSKIGKAPTEVLLARRPERLSFKEKALKEEHATLGAWLQVPSSSRWTQASLQLHENWKGVLRRLLFRSRVLTGEIKRASGRVQRFRVVPSTASDGLWMGVVENPGELVDWFGNEVPKDPVESFRLTGPGVADYQPTYDVRWTELVR